MIAAGQSLRLRHLRAAIDVVDDAVLVAAALRVHLAHRVGIAKQRAGIAPVDAGREREVHARGERLARRLGLSRTAARCLLDALIADARRAQGVRDDLDQGTAPPRPRMIAADMHAAFPPSARWLRLVPPPARLAPLARRVPVRWQWRAIERGVAHALAVPLADGALDFMQGRRIGIDVTDLGLCWTFELREGRLAVVDGDAEASVRGTCTDLMLLAARLEDADTLFFQRRLVLTGDTELGLHARNVLDRLPWDDVPLGARILLHRAARFARAARTAHREGHRSA